MGFVAAVQFCSAAANPFATTRIIPELPAGTLKENLPSAFVSAACVEPEEVRLTCEPGITAPVESCTVPLIWICSACALSGSKEMISDRQTNALVIDCRNARTPQRGCPIRAPQESTRRVHRLSRTDCNFLFRALETVSSAM